VNMSSAGQANIIVCSKCGAKNRIDSARRSEAVCGRCKTALAAEATPVTITDAKFGAEVENSPLPVLIDFWAAGCGPCRMVAPIITELANELIGKVRVGKLDVDANQRTAARFNVQSIPSMLIFKGGREVGRIVGAQSKDAILQKLNQYL